MRLSHSAEYISLRFIGWVLNLLPRNLALDFGATFGRIAWVLGIRKDLVISNLKHALPDASESELRRVGARAARNFGRTATEFIRYGKSDRDIVCEIIKVEGIESLGVALKQGNGAILLTGHLGSWAGYFAAISLQGIPLALLVGKQHNPKVDRFIHSLSRDEVELISKGKSAIKKVLNNLKEGRAVVMVADQHAGKTGIMTPFLGCETPTLALPASFSVKHSVPVFVLTGYRTSDGTHKVTVSPLELRPTENDDEKRFEILRSYNEALGEAIKQNPDQYFWYHRRWRDEDRELSESQ